MDITLMTNSSEKNKIGKSLTSLVTVSGTLKDDSSIINPSIMLDYDLSALPHCNYFYIPIWQRYYFMSDISSHRSALCVINGHVDVLESFKTQILANEAILHRQENNWNLYINDGLFHVYQNPHIQVKEFPNGFGELSRILIIAG